MTGVNDINQVVDTC